jgi:N-acetylglucosamine-6-phosphate deacetylase
LTDQQAGYLLTGGRVVTPDGVLAPGWIQTSGTQIEAVAPGDPQGQAGNATDVHGQWILPGFVDMHAHGGGGTSFTEGTAQDARAAAAFHLAHGTTSIVAWSPPRSASCRSGSRCWPRWPPTASWPACT